MAATTLVQVIVTAVDQASAVINNLGKSMNDVSANAKKGADIVSTASLAMGAALVAGAGVSIKMASDFQSAMELIRTQAGASQQEVDNMSKSVLNLSGQVATAPTALAEGLFHLESVGLRGAQALDVLRIAAEGAKVGQANLEDTTNALAASVVSGIKGVKDSAEAMGVLNAIVGAGNMRMEDLSASMGTGILASASAFGLSLQDVGAAMATMTDNGVPAIDAATRLRMTFSLLGAPTTQAQKALEGIGLASTQLADDMRSKGLVAAVQDLKDHLEASGKTASQQAVVIADAFGGGRSSSAILTLIQQLDRLKTKYTDINDATGKFGAAWDATQQTAAVNAQKFQAAMEALSIEAGTALLPAFTKLVNFLTNNVIPAVVATADFFQKHRVALAILAGVVGGLMVISLAAMAIEWWANVVAVAAFLGVTTAAFAPILLVAAAVAAVIVVVVLLILYWKDIINVLKEVGVWFENVFKKMVSAGGNFIKWMTGEFNSGVHATTNFFVNAWTSVQHAMQAFGNWVSTGFKNMVNAIGTFFTTVWKEVTLAFQHFIQWVVTTFGPAFNAVMNVIKFILIVIYDLFLLSFAGIVVALQKFGAWLISVFAPIFTAFFNLLKTMLMNEIAFWVGVWNTIENLLKKFGAWLSATFSPYIKAAFDFIKTLLTDIGNAFSTAWNAITSTLAAWGSWLGATFTSLVDAGFKIVQALLTSLENFFSEHWNAIKKTLDSWGSWLGKEFTGMIDVSFKWINNALEELSAGWAKTWTGIKGFVINVADEIVSYVKNMLNSIISFFNHMIDGANSVGSKVPGFIHIPSLPHFQTGGIVPGALGTPQLILAHGGEKIVPNNPANQAQSGGGITFQVNIGLYAGTDTEMRSVAKKMYSALAQLAQSQHKTVQELMGA